MTMKKPLAALFALTLVSSNVLLANTESTKEEPKEGSSTLSIIEWILGTSNDPSDKTLCHPFPESFVPQSLWDITSSGVTQLIDLVKVHHCCHTHCQTHDDQSKQMLAPRCSL